MDQKIEKNLEELRAYYKQAYSQIADVTPFDELMKDEEMMALLYGSLGFACYQLNQAGKSFVANLKIREFNDFVSRRLNGVKHN